MMSPPSLTSWPSIVAVVAAAFEAGLVGRAALFDALDEDAFFDRQVERLRQRRGDRAAFDPEVGVFDFAVGLELVDLVSGRVDRDREADADVALAAAAGLDLGVDPDHFAGRVDQRAARVAGVDRRVGLDHVVDREPVGRLDLALQGGDDAAGDGAVEAERVADRDHRVADFDLRGVAERERVQFLGRRVDLEQRQVVGRVGADHFGRVRVSEAPSLTVTLSAPSTTWLLVSTWPSVSITKPEPVATPPPGSGSPKGEARFASGSVRSAIR